MQRYLRLAGIGFAVCGAISFLLWSTISVVPWEQQQFNLMAAYFSVSGAYLVSLPALLCDIYARKRLWIDPRARCLGVSLVGASVGLFLLGWIAILSPNGLESFRTNQFDRLLCGVGPEPVWTQARQLIHQAELLATCKMLIDNYAQYMVAFAALALFSLALFDTLKPRWLLVSFVLGLLFPLPLFVLDALEQFDYTATPMLQTLTESAISWLVLGTFFGFVLIAIVWTVRDGWWTPVNTE